MDDITRAELRKSVATMLKRNRFQLVVRTSTGAYFKRNDGAYVLVTTNAVGEPKVERLDR